MYYMHANLSINPSSAIPQLLLYLGTSAVRSSYSYPYPRFFIDRDHSLDTDSYEYLGRLYRCNTLFFNRGCSTLLLLAGHRWGKEMHKKDREGRERKGRKGERDMTE